MDNRRFYAVQVPPEYQESPLEWAGMPDDVILTGNGRLKSYTTPQYDAILERYDECVEYWEELQRVGRERAYFPNLTAIINDFFPWDEFRARPYSTRDIHAIRRALDLYETRAYFDGDYIPEMLTALTGREWRSRELRGCCQGDWIECIYPLDNWSDAALEALETEVFNTGSEWTIHDDDTTPDGPEDVSGYSCYCYSWDDDGILQELANIAGCSREQLTVWKYTGAHLTPEYESMTGEGADV